MKKVHRFDAKGMLIIAFRGNYFLNTFSLDYIGILYEQPVQGYGRWCDGLKAWKAIL